MFHRHSLWVSNPHLQNAGGKLQIISKRAAIKFTCPLMRSTIDLEVTITWGGSMVHLWPPRWWGQDLFEWSFIHPYLLQETPYSLTPKSEGSGGRACCWTLGPVYRRGWARSRLAKHWGPLNICEWPQLYSRPSESQQSAENQNNVKGPVEGEIHDLAFTMFSLSEG